MASDDDLLSLISAELAKDGGGKEEAPAATHKHTILFFGVDDEARQAIKQGLGAYYNLIYAEELKQVPKLLGQVNAIIIDPSCSTASVGIKLTKKLKDDYQQIKVFHILRHITHEYGVYMNNFPFQNPDYAAELEQLPQLLDFIKTNLQ